MKRQSAFGIFALLFLAATTPSVVNATDGEFAIKTVLLGGDRTPLGGTFSGFGRPEINNLGHLAFDGSFDTGGQAIFFHDGTQTSLVVAPGQLAPDGGMISATFPPRLNDADEVAFHAVIGRTQAMLKWSRTGGLRYIVRLGDPTPLGGGFREIFNLSSINSGGEVVFGATVLDGTNVIEGIFAGNGDRIRVLVVAGQPTPVGGRFVSFASFAGGFVAYPHTLNDRGDLMFYASLADASAAEGLFVKSAADGRITPVALEGQSTPIGGTFGAFRSDVEDGGAVLNNFAEVVFVASLDNAPARGGIFKWRDGRTEKVIAAGDPSGYSECNIAALSTPTINDRSDVTFYSQVPNLCAVSEPRILIPTALQIQRAGVIQTIVSVFDVDSPPGGRWGGFSSPRINDRGEVAFAAVGFAWSSGLFIATPHEESIDVTIDIKPGGFPNAINLGSRGTVPVAVFSTDGFDARNINPLTIELAGAGVALRGRGSPMTAAEDVNGDGLLDLVIHIDTEALELTNSDVEAELTGETFDGLSFRGSDTIAIVPQ